MLKELSLNNFVIAKSCVISFGAGFNVLSGETGTGKTMLMQALALLLGQKADVKDIRKGEQKGVVQARFESCDHKVYECLIDSGIDIEIGDDLLISRELNLSGKHRIFINSQPAALPLLKILAPYLVEIISQHAQLVLKEASVQRDLLDEYGSLSSLREQYKESFLREEALAKKVTDYQAQRDHAKRELPFWEASLEEIKVGALEEGEEEALFQEYKKLSHLQELLKLGAALFFQLSEEPSSILERLKTIQKECDKLVQFDEELAPIQDLLMNSYDALSEASFQLSRYMNNLEQQPERFQEIESRLSSIRALHKKYGRSFAEIQTYQEGLVTNIQQVSQLELEISILLQELKVVSAQRVEQGKNLSKERIKYAHQLGTLLTEHVQTLNMHHARISIELTETAPTVCGCDDVSFQLSANLGEDFFKIKDHASGGELSRILFALKLILAEKEKNQTLVFDEIDANIGGVTAALLGKQLQHLGGSRQVICITHFPQVAAFADHHMHIHKTSSDGRIVTEVKTLSPQEKQEELIRMMGGAATLLPHHR